MDTTKFQIEIVEGNVTSIQSYPKDVVSSLSTVFGLDESDLENTLISKNFSNLICRQDQVETAISLLESIGISAEAKLAVSQILEEEEESLFGGLQIENLSFDLHEDSNLKQVAATQNENSKEIQNKKNEPLSSILSFDPKEEENSEGLKETPGPASHKDSGKAPKNNLSSSLSFTPEEDSTSKEDIPTPPKIINPAPPVKEEYQQTSEHKSAIVKDHSKPTKSHLEIKDSTPSIFHNKKTLVAIFGVAILAIAIFGLMHFGSTPSSNISDDQISNILKKRDPKEEISDSDQVSKNPAQSLKTSTYEGSITFDDFAISSTFIASDFKILELNLELKKTSPTLTSEEEFRTKIFLPRILSLRTSGANQDSLPNSNFSTTARITYNQGSTKKKEILPIFAKINEAKNILIISSNQDFDFSNETNNRVALEGGADQNSPQLKLLLQIPYQTLLKEEANTRSISDLIDAELNKHQKDQPKDNKKDKKKKIPVD